MKMDFDSNHPNANSCNNAARMRFHAAEPAALDDNLHQDILAIVPDLRRYARALTRNVAAADDLVQECLCRALAKIDLWERGTDLRAWLFTILHHQHINEIRRTLRRGIPVSIGDVVPTLAVAADALSAVQLRELQRVLASLPEAQRQVIVLVGRDGMKYEDVATFLGIPIGTVRSRIARGRAMLRKLMDREDDAASSSPAAACVPLPCSTPGGFLEVGA